MANVTFAANRQLYSLILVNQATERNAFTTQFNVETSQQVAALQHGVQQANPNATQQELSDASAPYIDARSAQRAANLDEMDAQHAAAARHQTYNLAGQSAEMADLGATTAIQTGVHQHAAQSAKIEYLENQLTGMENDLRHVETVQGVVRDWSTYWPPQPMPQAHDDPHNVIVDTVVDGKRLRVVPGPAQGQEYTNLTQQANAFVAPVIPQDEDPHPRDPETLRTVEGKGYALPDVPVSDDEVKRAILTFDTWPGGCGLLLAAYLALGHHLYQQYVIGILTEAMALVTTGVDCIADLLYGPNRPTLFLVAIRRMGGRGPGIAGWFHAAGPVFSPIWSAGNACAGYLANYEVSCIVGLGGPGPTLAQLAHAGYDRLMVITRNMFFAETCTQGEYISGSTSKGTFMGVCFTGLGLLRADTLRLTHIGYNNPHETWKRIQGHLELDCVFCLLSATVTNSSARGRIRMHGGVGDGLVVLQTRLWKFDTAMMETRVQVMGQRRADMKDRTQHALAYAVRENFGATWLQAEAVATLGFQAATIFNEAAHLAGQIHASVVPLDNAIAHPPQNANLPQMVANRTTQLNPYYRACTLLWRSMRLMFGAMAAAQRLYPDD